MTRADNSRPVQGLTPQTFTPPLVQRQGKIALALDPAGPLSAGPNGMTVLVERPLYLEPGSATKIKLDQSEIQGTPGPAGPSGPPGATGPTGATGATGPAGAAGYGATHSLKTSDQTLIGTAFADVTETGLSVSANTTYQFIFWIILDADAATTGIDISVNGPASPTAIVYQVLYWTSTTASQIRGQTAYDANTASTASNGTTRRMFRAEGILVNGANAGTLIARVKREAVGSGPNARAGSFGMLWQLS